MQYQPHTTHHQSSSINFFSFFLCINDANYAYLITHAWAVTTPKNCEPFCTIIICNIKSIQKTTLQKMTKNLFFGSLDHSQMQCCAFWMILHELVILPKVKKHLVLSQYTMSTRSNRPNSRKWPKTSFLPLGIIQKCNLVIFEWSSISDIMAKLLTPFSWIRIYNIKLTKLEKMANSAPGGHLQPTRRRKNFLKNQPDFSWTSSFRGISPKGLIFRLDSQI